MNQQSPFQQPPAEHVLFYDARCELCRRSQRLLERSRRPPLQFVDVNDPAAMAHWPQVDPERAQQEVLLLEPSGKLSGGYDAVVTILARRSSSLERLLPVLQRPMTRKLGASAYRWVSRHRSEISRWIYSPTTPRERTQRRAA